MESDSDRECEAEGLSNVLIIEGTYATGKTAAVHACASQLGYTIIELNSSHLRNTTAVKKSCSEGNLTVHLSVRTLRDNCHVSVFSIRIMYLSPS